MAMFRLAQAQPPSPDALSVAIGVDRERITVGDPLHYTVHVMSPPGALVEWPEQPRTVGAFEVRSFAHEGPFIRADGWSADTLRYELTVYETGVHTIPPLALPYTLQDGRQGVAQTDSARITVASVIDDEAKDIRDLKDPADIPVIVPWYLWIAAAVLALGLMAGGVYLYRRWKRRLEEEETAPPAPRLPHEIAYDELEQLARFRWIEQDKIAEHYTALSEIIRRYVAARYNVPAMEITTNELVRHLGNRSVRLDHIRLIDALLQECDLVKFAKFIPEPDRMAQSIDEARAVVDHTKQIAVPAPSPPEPARVATQV